MAAISISEAYEFSNTVVWRVLNEPEVEDERLGRRSGRLELTSRHSEMWRRVLAIDSFDPLFVENLCSLEVSLILIFLKIYVKKSNTGKKKHKQKKQDSFIGHELTFQLWR